MQGNQKRQWLARKLFASETTKSRTLGLSLARVSLSRALVSSSILLSSVGCSYQNAILSSAAIVRLSPQISRAVDRELRPLSPYAENRLEDGSYSLPRYSLTAATCDVQHLGWLGIGNSHTPRFVTEIWPAAVTFVVRKSTKPIIGDRASKWVALSSVLAWNLIRARTIRDYHIDPLGIASGALSWGPIGADLGDKRLLLSEYLIAYPWGTPTPGRC